MLIQAKLREENRISGFSSKTQLNTVFLWISILIDGSYPQATAKSLAVWGLGWSSPRPTTAPCTGHVPDAWTCEGVNWGRQRKMSKNHLCRPAPESLFWSLVTPQVHGQEDPWHYLLISLFFLKLSPILFQITTSSPDTSILEILNFLLDHFFLYLLICVQHKALSLQGLHRHQRGPKEQPPPEGGVPGDSESGWRQQQQGPPGNSAGMGGRHVVACRAQEEKTNSLSLWCPPLTIP